MQNGKVMYGYAECKSCVLFHGLGSVLKAEFQAHEYNVVWHVKMVQPICICNKKIMTFKPAQSKIPLHSKI